MKMTTKIPPAIATPDSVETRFLQPFLRFANPSAATFGVSSEISYIHAANATRPPSVAFFSVASRFGED